MKTYEAFVILKPILDVDNSDNVLKNFEDLIESTGGKVLRKDKIGRKRLAYEIKKFKDGFITTYVVSMNPAKLADFQRACHINEDILRLMMVSRDDMDLDAATFSRPERQQNQERPDRPERGERPFRERSERPVRAAE